eukprot:TRINITY_DN22549_c0_g1_i1.p1 TRINITY_DN22549_c0_g1~~TRINITY_DN22549_c0_g1_i1.p1  ORF type:complete len:301 (-),score=48.43 TRINITY_DN22549_c0_g1_i1:36-938(-)
MLSFTSAVSISLFLPSVAALELAKYDAVMQRPSKRGLFLFHIAKTAGTSAAHDLDTYVNAHGDFRHRECCYPSLGETENSDVVTFLREPVSHVFSQWMHCKQNKDDYFNPQGLPETLTAWLEHWSRVGDATPSPRNAFNCYMPSNLQARALTCTKRKCSYSTPGLDSSVLNDTDGSFTINETLARERIAHDVFAVGLTEFYQESLCLVHAKRERNIPEQCNCENARAWRKFKMANQTHGGAAPAREDKVTHADVKMIKRLNRIDDRLYQVALERFERDVRSVERQYGKRILCQELRRASV